MPSLFAGLPEDLLILCSLSDGSARASLTSAATSRYMTSPSFRAVVLMGHSFWWCPANPKASFMLLTLPASPKSSPTPSSPPSSFPMSPFGSSSSFSSLAKCVQAHLGKELTARLDAVLSPDLLPCKPDLPFPSFLPPLLLVLPLTPCCCCFCCLLEEKEEVREEIHFFIDFRILPVREAGEDSPVADGVRGGEKGREGGAGGRGGQVGIQGVRGVKEGEG